MKTFLLASLALVCIIALSVVAAACDDEDKSVVVPTTTPLPSATSTDTLAAQLAALPTAHLTATPRPVSPDLRTCTDGDLNAARVSGQGALGQSFAYIVIGNASSTECQLSSPPGFRFLDEYGNNVLFELLWTEPCPASFECTYTEPIGLTPNLGSFAESSAGPTFPGQVFFTLAYRSHDGSGRCEPPARQASDVRLILPNEGGEVQIDMGGGAVRSCFGTVGVWGYHLVR